MNSEADEDMMEETSLYIIYTAPAALSSRASPPVAIPPVVSTQASCLDGHSFARSNNAQLWF